MVPVVVLGEDPRPPARQQGEEPGRQVPGGVDGVAAVVSEAEADTQHGQTHPHRHQLLVQLRIQRQHYRCQEESIILDTTLNSYKIGTLVHKVNYCQAVYGSSHGLQNAN